MSYQHCDPCDNFDLCGCCGEEMCVTCGESFNSEHINLNDEAHKKLIGLIEEEMLMPATFCRECLFYAHHDINNPEQADYDENLVYEVKHENVEVEKPFRGKVVETRKSIAIVGEKPKRTFTTQKGPFYFPPPKK
ncbi:hypothetical protein F4Z99_17480 [Candidatus Poribacteria bacterium]|nr:hypothetical protein [Candidatus Poribacteria bacterium]